MLTTRPGNWWCGDLHPTSSLVGCSSEMAMFRQLRAGGLAPSGQHPRAVQGEANLSFDSSYIGEDTGWLSKKLGEGCNAGHPDVLNIRDFPPEVPHKQRGPGAT